MVLLPEPFDDKEWCDKNNNKKEKLKNTNTSIKYSGQKFRLNPAISSNSAFLFGPNISHCK